MELYYTTNKIPHLYFFKHYTINIPLYNSITLYTIAIIPLYHYSIILLNYLPINKNRL